MIKELAREHRISELCELFEVSRSGYYAWLNRKPSVRKQIDEQLGDQIKVIHQNSRKIYGCPRITRALKAKGVRCSRKRVARIMKKNAISGAQKARFRPRTTDEGKGSRLNNQHIACPLRRDVL